MQPKGDWARTITDIANSVGLVPLVNSLPKLLWNRSCLRLRHAFRSASSTSRNSDTSRMSRNGTLSEANSDLCSRKSISKRRASGFRIEPA